MRLAELSAREDVTGVLTQTLQDYLQNQNPDAVVELAQKNRHWGQVWRENRLLSALHTARPASSVRMFLRDLFRFTNRWHRQVPQAIVVSGAATPMGMSLASVPRFMVHPPVPSAESQFILPGNERIRWFDLEQGTTRVWVKHGYNTTRSRNEIAARTTLTRGDVPWVPILAHAKDGQWFDEPIVQGFTVPRCPPWIEKRSLLSEAMARLSVFYNTKIQSRDVGEYAEYLIDQLSNSYSQLGVPIETIMMFHKSWVGLVAALSERPQVSLVPSHGDFQAGNIFWDRQGKRIYILDWEYLQTRTWMYDIVTLAFGSRNISRLRGQISNYIAGRNTELIQMFTHFGQPFDEWGQGSISQTGRVAQMSLFLLEDWLWRVGQVMSWPKPSAETAVTIGQNYADAAKSVMSG